MCLEVMKMQCFIVKPQTLSPQNPLDPTSTKP